jgi:SNF2 family DNA or RNA helicase
VPDARPNPQQQLPILGERSHFHRVILDEAQNIKNRNTKSAAAACRINADYRWCLSGTPMQNNVDEIYSLIKFCRIRPYHDYEKFAKDISRPLKRLTSYGKEQAMERLQALLRAVLLRRTKKSEIDGQPIIQLPEKHTIEERAIFGKDELDFYKALEAQSQIQFNKFLKKGSIGRHYSHALVLLLRLRQCCCSAQLVTNAPDFMTSGAIEDVDYVKNAKSLPDDVVRRLGEAEGFECPICMDAVENPIIFNLCGHSLCAECLTAMTEKALDDASGKLLCPHCRGSIDINLVTNHESFLQVHHPERANVQPLEDQDEEDAEEPETDSDSDSDSDDGDDEDDGEDLRDFIVPDDKDIEYDTDADEDQKKKLAFKHFKPDKNSEDEKSLRACPEKDIKNTKHSKTKKMAKGKGKGKAKKSKTTLADLRKEGLKSAKKRYLKKLAKVWLPSAKIEKTVQLLQEIKDRGQGEKTIVL